MTMVKVKETCRVNPWPEKTNSDQDLGTKFFPLTFFDTMWLVFPPTQRIFFYPIHNLLPHLFYDTILPKLKHSLSLTLPRYPSLAGNLTWHPHTGEPIIRYREADGGVLFSAAESCADDFDSLAAHDFKKADGLQPLLPDFHASETEATVLSLRVTLFPAHGFSIGYCAHHASMDGKSAAMFLKSWAAICRDGISLPPGPNTSGLIDDPLGVSAIFVDQWMKMMSSGGSTDRKRSLSLMGLKPPAGLIRSTFRLTRNQVAQIKGKMIKSPVSTFTAVCAYIWTCLVRTDVAVGDMRHDNVNLLVNVDCRGRWEPPIPDNYFGNCVTYRIAKAKVESLKAGDGVAAAAAAIRVAIESLAGNGVMERVENWVSDVQSAYMREKMYNVGGSAWFDLYGVDFGWGRPGKVEMVSIDKSGAFSLCDSRDDGNGAMEIGIVLSKLKIEAFASIFAQTVQDFSD